MVLLAAAISTKSGKALVSRQFVEMSRPRIEGLLAAFPKLLSSEKSGTRQHTFVETDSVRYVYQPMDQLYVLLITTKASNILEDLETLRLFSRVIPEYCRTIDEKEIGNQAFQLIFAFDEIVALGYRENVNLAQIRTFTEMDSHEERVFYQIKKTQEEEAKKLARDRAKEISKIKQDVGKRGGRPPSTMMGMGGGSYNEGPVVNTNMDNTISENMPTFAPKIVSRPSGPNKAMKLGSKKVDEESFINQLKSEGQDILAQPKAGSSAAPAAVSSIAPSNFEKVHIRVEEKIVMSMTRDGGLQTMEVNGLCSLRITDEAFAKVKVIMDIKDTKGAPLQTHPNLDKGVFQAENVLMLKVPGKPFPLNNDIGVLKWRYQTNDETQIPLSINCWPSESGAGCDVNIEYTLEDERLELRDVVISIPLPSGVAPVISECDGEYKYEKMRQNLEWKLPVVDSKNKSGTLEFSTGSGHSDNFFPVKVSFVSQSQFCQIKAANVVKLEGGEPVKFSSETTMFTDKYEIV